MLFLLAGYEVELKELTGHGGRILSRGRSGALALGLVGVVGLTGSACGNSRCHCPCLDSPRDTAAYPERQRAAEREVGSAVINHGAFGELCPIIAMALLLSSSAALASIGVLTIFTVVAVIFTLPSAAVADDRSAAGAPTPRASHGRQRYGGPVNVPI